MEYNVLFGGVGLLLGGCRITVLFVPLKIIKGVSFSLYSYFSIGALSCVQSGPAHCTLKSLVRGVVFQSIHFVPSMLLVDVDAVVYIKDIISGILG